MGTQSYRPVCDVCSTLIEETDEFELTDEDEANAAFIVTACNSYASDRARIASLEAALREIAAGCIPRRPGHVDANLNRTKDEIGAIADAVLIPSSEDHGKMGR